MSGATSRAFLVTTDVAGGAGSLGGPFQPGGGPGTGLVVDHAKAILRAAGDHSVESGLDPSHTSSTGKAIAVTGAGGVVLVSDVNYDPASVLLTQFGKLKIPPEPEPFVVISQSSEADLSAHLLVHGPAGQPGLLLASFEAAVVPLAKLELSLWVEPAGLIVVPVVTAGIDQPLDFAFHVPIDPNLAGTVLLAQAVFPDLASTLAVGKAVVTNPAALVVRY